MTKIDAKTEKINQFLLKMHQKLVISA